MRLNRYRLRHLADEKHGGAMRAHKLLSTPDRLIGVILLGNNFVNILITQLATYIGFRLYGDIGIAIATGVLTIILLIFAEVAPKTVAASFKRSWPLLTGRNSPDKPISPKTTRSAGKGLSLKLESMANTMARSDAVSLIRTPPTALTKTS